MKKVRGHSNQPRKTAMYLAQELGGHGLTEKAIAFGLKHYGGLSNAIYLLSKKMEEGMKLKRAIKSIINRFYP